MGGRERHQHYTQRHADRPTQAPALPRSVITSHSHTDKPTHKHPPSPAWPGEADEALTASALFVGQTSTQHTVTRTDPHKHRTRLGPDEALTASALFVGQTNTQHPHATMIARPGPARPGPARPGPV